jgi:hypothetical protein
MSNSSQDKKMAKADAKAAAAKAKALRPWFQKKRVIIPVALAVIIGISVASNSGGNNSADMGSVDTSTEPAESAAPQEETTTETIGQINAKQSAEDYLNFAAFSREGLIEQLEFEDYSKEDAEYAVDALNVDWNEQAAKSAEAYLETTSFSKQSLIDQLVFEGFTKEQAKFGVEAAGY